MQLIERLIISVLIFILIFTVIEIKGQEIIDEPDTSNISFLYMGMGFGFNNYEGLIGAGFEMPFFRRISVFGSGGLGSWGYKAGGGLCVYLKRTLLGSAFNLGYSHSFGEKGFATEMEVTGSQVPEDVILDMYATGTLNFCYSYSWPLGNKGKFSLGGGYALPREKKPYKVMNDVELTDSSEFMMNFLSPGGPVIYFKFMFGL